MKNLVSVVVPALNEEKYIRNCLESLKKQDYKGEYEIIVSDGLSTDDTALISRKYADKVVFEKSRTIAAGRQKGVSVAKGKIIAFTDADSQVPPDWLSRLVAPFDDKEVVCTYGSVFLYDGTALDRFIAKYIFLFFMHVMQVFGKPNGAGSNMAFRKTTFKKVGGFNIDLAAGEDLDLLRKLKKHGKIVFASDAKVFVSSRRMKKWGYLKFLLFHMSNMFKVQFEGKAEKTYEPIR
ncbi:MAG: glycosyltransferase [Candidatus Micrarchaeia archaeon]